MAQFAMIELDRRLREKGFRAIMMLQFQDEVAFGSPTKQDEQLSAMVVDCGERCRRFGGDAPLERVQ